MKKEPTGYPVLLGFPEYYSYPGKRDAGVGATVWCSHCRLWHHHGWQDGHRAAHCVDRPFDETGYFIRCLTRTKAKELKRDLEKYLAITAPRTRGGGG